MKGKSILLVGCGDLGVRLGKQLLALGCRVHALRRNVSALPAGFAPIAADYSVPGALDFCAQLAPDVVVFTPTPGGGDAAAYERSYQWGAANLVNALATHRPAAVLLSSSTRVYAETQGGWVDEHAALREDDACAQAIIAAEQTLLHSQHRACAVRFAGIYGAGAGRLLKRVAAGEISAVEPVVYGNRIHREDCAGLLLFLVETALAARPLPNVLLAADDSPAPRHEVEAWLAGELGVNSPREVASPVRANRRCSNARMRELGYALKYPDYQAGYGELLNAIS